MGPRFKSFVDRKIVRTLPSKFSIRTADGTIHSSTYSLLLPISYYGRSHDIEAPLLTSLKHDLVLCVDFSSKISNQAGDCIEAEKQINVSENIQLREPEAAELPAALL